MLNGLADIQYVGVFQAYNIVPVISYAVVTRESKLFENYFRLRWRPPEIILFRRVETCLKLQQNYFEG